MTTDRSRNPAWSRLLLVVGAGLVSFGCAAGTPRLASDIEQHVPPELREDYLSFTINCSKCHDLDRPLRAHIDDVRHWDLYVAKMMRTASSAISARESPKILRFLYWYTERKNRLESERAKEVTEPVEKAPEPSPVPAPAAPAPAPNSVPEQPEANNPVSPTPAPANASSQVSKGEGTP